MHGGERRISPTILIDTCTERMTKVVRRILTIPLSGHTYKLRHHRKREWCARSSLSTLGSDPPCVATGLTARADEEDRCTRAVECCVTMPRSLASLLSVAWREVVLVLPLPDGLV